MKVIARHHIITATQSAGKISQYFKYPFLNTVAYQALRKAQQPLNNVGKQQKLLGKG